MDGFALAARKEAQSLRVAGEIAMGSAWPAALVSGTALAIPTGAVVPEGADTVVPIEEAQLRNGVVSVGPTEPGENVNRRAHDMRGGEPVLQPGRRIRGPELGVLATLGLAEVSVFRRPSIGVLSSGDELIAVAAYPRLGQIRDSNRYAVAGTLLAMGAAAVHLPTVNDEPGALEAGLRAGLDRCDAVVVTGGSSVGERDRTPGAIAALGTPGVVVHGLKVKPGKPTVLAAAGGKPVIGLPGNPASALMILEAIAAPIVAAMTGVQSEVPFEVDAVLDAPARSRLGWTWYVPVSLRHEGAAFVAHPLPLRSSMVSLTARADGYLEIAPQLEEVPAGTSVRIRSFR